MRRARISIFIIVVTWFIASLLTWIINPYLGAIYQTITWTAWWNYE